MLTSLSCQVQPQSLIRDLVSLAMRFGLSCLSILVAADESDFQQWAVGDFATDRQGRAKGVVEIEL